MVYSITHGIVFTLLYYLTLSLQSLFVYRVGVQYEEVATVASHMTFEEKRQNWYTNIGEGNNTPVNHEKNITLKHLNPKLKNRVPTKFNVECHLFQRGLQDDYEHKYSTLTVYLKASLNKHLILNRNDNFFLKLTASVYDKIADKVLGSVSKELENVDPAERISLTIHRLVKHEDILYSKTLTKYLEVQLDVELTCSERVRYLPTKELVSEDPEMAIYEFSEAGSLSDADEKADEKH